jgi:S1-C subfamily serine protease
MGVKLPVWYRKAALFLVLLSFVLISQAEGGLDESSRIKLIKALAGSVVGVNSIILKSSDLVSQKSYKGTGSGFIVDTAGHVATLRNIISDTHSIEVILRDGTTWPAILKGEDSDTGIAVLEVQAPAEVTGRLQHVKFAGAGTVIPGRDVLVLGRTEGGEMLMAASGMVSCAARTMLTFRGDPLHDIIQTDRPFASGFDGGPMFDTEGHVLGMTASSLLKTGDASPVADFAVPSSTLSWVVTCIIENGRVVRPWFGADLVTVTPALARFLGLPVTCGALITSLVPGGPAEKAGFQSSEKTLRLGNRVYPVGGDIVVAIGRSSIGSDADIIRKLREYEPGDTAVVSVYRGNRLLRLKVRFGTR